MEENLIYKTAFNERRHPIKYEHQSKTISNGRCPPKEDDIQWKMSSNGRWPPRKDNLQGKTNSNKRRHPIADDLQDDMRWKKISTTTVQNWTYMFLGWKLGKNSSVALLSPTCLIFFKPWRWRSFVSKWMMMSILLLAYLFTLQETWKMTFLFQPHFYCEQFL